MESAADVQRLAAWLLNLWDTLAMGNFPYPSNYLVYQQTHDASVRLPAWPFRAVGFPGRAPTSWDVWEKLPCSWLPPRPPGRRPALACRDAGEAEAEK